MDTERLLISKILDTGDFVHVVDARIGVQFFSNPRMANAWEFIREHWENYGQVPTGAALSKRFGKFNLPEADEPLDYYIDELRKEYKGRLLHKALNDASTLLIDDDLADPGTAAVSVLTDMLSTVAIDVTSLRDVDLTRTADARIQRYETYKDFIGGLRGIPSGFKGIDRILSGWQKEQLITLVGLPKAGKSTYLLLFAIAAHLAGYRVLFIGFEMSNEEQEARHDAMRAQLDHNKLMRGQLSDKEMAVLRRVLKSIEEMEHAFTLSTDVSSATTIAGIQAKVVQHTPDIVFVDGVYLMDDELGQEKGSPQALTNITRGLKRLAQKMRIPVVCSTQALSWKTTRRKGITADSIGYTSSFAQDSDVVLGIDKDEEDESIAKVKVVLSRATRTGFTKARLDWSTGTYTEMEFGDAEDDEDEDDDALTKPNVYDDITD